MEASQSGEFIEQPHLKWTQGHLRVVLSERSTGEVATGKIHLSYHKSIMECQLEVLMSHKVEIFF